MTSMAKYFAKIFQTKGKCITSLGSTAFVKKLDLTFFILKCIDASYFNKTLSNSRQVYKTKLQTYYNSEFN